jgi:hypothetical protein
MSCNACYNGSFGKGYANEMSRKDFTYLLGHFTKGGLILNKL